MSLKDHLRSLPDMDFLRELEDSERDLQEQESSQRKEKADDQDASGSDAASDDSEQHNGSVQAGESASERVKGSRTGSSVRGRQDAKRATPPLELEEICKAVVTIEADSRHGKGFIVDSEGRILTNLHLVESAFLLRVSLSSGDVFLARLLKADRNRDLALIQIPARTQKHLTIAHPDCSLDVGDEVYVLHGASGAGKMIRSTICGLRTLDGDSLLQVNHALAETDTGGPFLSVEGSVIGVCNPRRGDVDEAGFAVSVKEIHGFLSA